MKIILGIILFCLWIGTAHSESFFEAEVGLGASRATDVDGVWTQHNVKDNHERLVTPAYLAGITGSLYDRQGWSLHYHLDYTYIGTQMSSCACVSDADYGAQNYDAAATRFSGSGHIQGIVATLEPGYTWRGIRLAVESGPFIFWNTWNEFVAVGTGVHVNADRGARIGYVFGARVEYQNVSLSYRYYTHIERSNSTYPGLVRNMHVLMLVYRF